MRLFDTGIYNNNTSRIKSNSVLVIAHYPIRNIFLKKGNFKSQANARF
jgi:hypothetical protein